ncbi:hypothetical protein [Halorussus halobius]|uniref:hypothetical protein n=1 Tax=Halorussus halobius TaxID=1710537 RepID=UPI0010928004|nr:hypothetical protein [Halorussus halobius]
MAGIPAPDRSDLAGAVERADRERTRAGAVALLAAALGLVALGGLRGVAGAAVLGIAWLLLAPTETFAVGQAAAVALAVDGGPFGLGIGLPGGASTATVAGVALAEAGLFGLLFAPDRRPATPAGSAALAVGWALGGGALAWAGRSWLAPWLGALVLLGATGLAAGLLHRYQVVSLGLAAGAERPGGGSDER